MGDLATRSAFASLTSASESIIYIQRTGYTHFFDCLQSLSARAGRGLLLFAHAAPDLLRGEEL